MNLFSEKETTAQKSFSEVAQVIHRMQNDLHNGACGVNGKSVKMLI